jgi:hypothetical protein
MDEVKTQGENRRVLPFFISLAQYITRALQLEELRTQCGHAHIQLQNRVTENRERRMICDFEFSVFGSRSPGYPVLSIRTKPGNGEPRTENDCDFKFSAFGSRSPSCPVLGARLLCTLIHVQAEN